MLATTLVSKELKPSSLMVKRDLAIVSFLLNRERYFIIVGYCSPSELISGISTEMQKFIINHRDEIIIMCDLNDKSELWGRNKIDNRGQELLELINKNDLDVLSDTYGPPTSNATIGTS